MRETAWRDKLPKPTVSHSSGYVRSARSKANSRGSPIIRSLRTQISVWQGTLCFVHTHFFDNFSSATSAILMNPQSAVVEVEETRWRVARHSAAHSRTHVGQTACECELTTSVELTRSADCTWKSWNVESSVEIPIVSRRSRGRL